MALFFDQEWFDARLVEAGRTRDDVAAALRITRGEVDEIWKDQRELSPNEVTMLARLLSVPTVDVVSRAGISTPAPASSSAGGGAPSAGQAEVLAKLEEVNQRLMRMERALTDLQSLVLAGQFSGGGSGSAS